MYHLCEHLSMPVSLCADLCMLQMITKAQVAHSTLSNQQLQYSKLNMIVPSRNNRLQVAKLSKLHADSISMTRFGLYSCALSRSSSELCLSKCLHSYCSNRQVQIWLNAMVLLQAQCICMQMERERNAGAAT